MNTGDPDFRRLWAVDGNHDCRITGLVPLWSGGIKETGQIERLSIPFLDDDRGLLVLGMNSSKRGSWARGEVDIASMILGAGLFDRFMHHGFLFRALTVMASVFSLGILLGIYFPFGLELVGSRHEQTIPWAWAINSGFSVLGGIVAIILAQLIGFSMILVLACLVHLVAGHSLTRMLELSRSGAGG